MVKAEVDQTLDSFDTALNAIKAGLEAMVESFAVETAYTAIDQTPLGDDSDPLYNLNSRMRYLPAESGYAKGGWVLSLNSPSREEFPNQAFDYSASNIKQDARLNVSSYKLGQDIYITNNVPYVSQDGWTLDRFLSLESGYSQNAPYGIRRPTVNIVVNILNKNLVRYYKTARYE